MVKRRAVFLDRDGVLNVKAAEGDYVTRWEDFHFLPRVPEALSILKALGFLLIVITNQRGAALGMMSETTVREIHGKMMEELRTRGVELDSVYYCVHDIPDGCDCRKPRTGMIDRAIADLGAKGVELDFGESYVVGDSESDMVLGRTAGLRTVKIGDSPWDSDVSAESLFVFSKSLER